MIKKKPACNSHSKVYLALETRFQVSFTFGEASYVSFENFSCGSRSKSAAHVQPVKSAGKDMAAKSRLF